MTPYAAASIDDHIGMVTQMSCTLGPASMVSTEHAFLLCFPPSQPHPPSPVPLPPASVDRLSFLSLGSISFGRSVEHAVGLLALEGYLGSSLNFLPFQESAFCASVSPSSKWCTLLECVMPSLAHEKSRDILRFGGPGKPNILSKNMVFQNRCSKGQGGRTVGSVPACCA